MQGSELEREALHRLPAILADLFDELPEDNLQRQQDPDAGIDAVFNAGGRTWLIELKSSSSPGVVANAASQLAAFETAGARSVLVVPYMSQAGARAAEAHGLNWIDLSGNASLRDDQLRVWVEGRPNAFPSRGRPSSAFAPKSSRVARALLLFPSRWWRQADLSKETRLDPSQVSRIVSRMSDEEMLDRDGSLLRPRDPETLLDAWADEYRFDRHDVIRGHLTGSGFQLAKAIGGDLRREGFDHAFTGLPAAYAIDEFARFRLCTLFVADDPRVAADAIGLRRNERGANVQIIGPDDDGVFYGRSEVRGLSCVSPVQIYLDLLNLPERAAEAAEHLRFQRGLATQDVG